MPDLSCKGACRTMSSSGLRYIERRTLELAIEDVSGIGLRGRAKYPTPSPVVVDFAAISGQTHMFSTLMNTVVPGKDIHPRRC